MTDDVLREINEMIIAYNTSDDPTPSGGSHPDTDEKVSGGNSGILILDETCVPQFDYYILWMYHRNTGKDYLNLAKCKKHTSKKIRKAIHQQLQYIRRDRKYINELLESECELTQKQGERLAVIDRV